MVVANIAVSEQIGEMLIHCKYGCKLSEESQNYVVDPGRCPVTVKIANRRYDMSLVVRKPVFGVSDQV